MRLWGIWASAIFGAAVGALPALSQSVLAQVPRTSSPDSNQAVAAAIIGPIQGSWEGQYSCAQGATGLTLIITGNDPQQLAARFRFYPLPQNPRVPNGEFELSGEFNPATGQINLRPARWINQPPNFGMVPVKGVLDRSSGRLEGTIEFTGCGPFLLARSAISVAPATEIAAAQQPARTGASPAGTADSVRAPQIVAQAGARDPLTIELDRLKARICERDRFDCACVENAFREARAKEPQPPVPSLAETLMFYQQRVDKRKCVDSAALARTYGSECQRANDSLKRFNRPMTVDCSCAMKIAMDQAARLLASSIYIVTYQSTAIFQQASQQCMRR